MTDRRLEEIAPGLLVATAPMYTTTSTLLGAQDGSWVVVDPAITPQEVRGLAVAALSRGRVAGGFATHPHWDHVLWCADLGDVSRWATRATAQVAEREHERLVDGAKAAPGHDAGLIGSLTALDGDRLPWSREVVVVEHGAHAPGSAALVLPDVGVMIAGDMLSDIEVPLLDLDDPEPLRAYRAGLRVLEEAVHRFRVTVVVPGHGSACRGDEIQDRFRADHAYLDSLESAAESDADAHAHAHADDPRLADAWQRGEHDRQRAAVS